jgi:hypothetical protein
MVLPLYTNKLLKAAVSVLVRKHTHTYTYSATDQLLRLIEWNQCKQFAFTIEAVRRICLTAGTWVQSRVTSYEVRNQEPLDFCLRFSLATIFPIPLHDIYHLLPQVCDNPSQAAHYYILRLKLGAWSLWPGTWLVRQLSSPYRFRYSETLPVVVFELYRSTVIFTAWYSLFHRGNK